MNDPIAGWRAEHRNFSRLLELFDREVERFHSAERPDYELMLDVLTYLRHFPEHTHHPREDVAFKRLVRHDHAIQPVVNRLLQEHRVIAEIARQLQDLLEALQGDEFVARAEVEAACATFLVYYRHHIAGEEDRILPLAGRLLTPDDWKAVGAAVSSAPDPLFGSDVDARYRELRDRIDAEAG
ncbi:MAG TPA: hemerythrin domain-containing protein [Burkholderiales bacterium]|nr:hemerythrin domain-containing protein [Burkholderiales bacterium]